MGREAILALHLTAGDAAVAALLASTAEVWKPVPRTATIRPVQRAVMAIDGASDDQTAKAITCNCLSTLVTKKQISEPSGREKPEFPGVAFTGKVKLVACYGASLKVDDLPVRDIAGNPITRPYAGELTLAGSTGKFRPSSVDGLTRISWVDEDTTRRRAKPRWTESWMRPTSPEVSTRRRWVRASSARMRGHASTRSSGQGVVRLSC